MKSKLMWSRYADGLAADVDTRRGKVSLTGTNDMSDGWITKVKSTYMYSIEVSTNAGIVTLTGKVDSGAERALAIELARNVRGVKSVESKALTM